MQPGKSPLSTGYVSTADGTRLFFQVVGDGAETVVIPNGMCLYDDFAFLSERRRLVFYDLRNRGLSDSISDVSKLKGGIHNDVDDLEAVRRHLGISKMTLMGHSYVGLMIILYAMKHGAGVRRMVQLAPAQPYAGRQYPSHLTCDDGVLQEVLAKLAEIQKERSTQSSAEFCMKFWSILRMIYVANPADAAKVDWGRCDLPNERNVMKYWTESIFPSMQALRLTSDDFAKVTVPVLILHGTRDRSAPYGGAREWGLLLPNARLVSLEQVAHALWIEAPERVFGAIGTFLEGAWPHGAEEVSSLTDLPNS
jgi:proline iminopeptidase